MYNFVHLKFRLLTFLKNLFTCFVLFFFFHWVKIYLPSLTFPIAFLILPPMYAQMTFPAFYIPQRMAQLTDYLLTKLSCPVTILYALFFNHCVACFSTQKFKNLR